MSKSDGIGIELSDPRTFILRMGLFLGLIAFLLILLGSHLVIAFKTSPGLNTVIIAVLVTGILFAFRQVMRLQPEIRWVSEFRKGDPGLAISNPPKLLAPMAVMLGDRKGRVQLNTASMRSILDSIGSRLDEDREVSRYMIGLLIFLGLLGTFWGLLNTVTAVGSTIHGLNVGASDPAAAFQNLKSGLEGPLQGMGTSFSSSLFGLAGSLILGFLDLQAGQAQNRFYNDLEEWLSTVTNIVGEGGDNGQAFVNGKLLNDALRRLERIEEQLTREVASGAPGSLRVLADELNTLAATLRDEHELIRKVADTQNELYPTLERLSKEISAARIAEAQKALSEKE